MSEQNNNAVGVVADVKGNGTIIRTDGTSQVIEQNTPVFQGDTIETDSEGAVNITFNDNTVFAVSNNAKMVIDEFVYDPNKDGEGQADVSVVRGVFLYTSGFVGKEDHDDVHIKTPVGSIGIRGTTLTGYIPDEGSSDKPQISLIEGAIVVQPNSGPEIFLDESRETVELNSEGTHAENIGIVPAQEFINDFNVVRSVAPQLFTPVDSILLGEVPNHTTDPAEQREVTPEESQIDQQQTIEDESLPNEEQSAITSDEAQKIASGNELQAIEMEMSLLGDPMQDLFDLSPQGEFKHLIDFLSNDSGLLFDEGGLLMPPTFPNSFGDNSHIYYNPALHAPIALIGTYYSLEQAGLEANIHSIDISRYFYDPDGTELSYQITGIDDPNNSLSDVFVSGDNLVFTASSTMSGDETIGIHVAAFDGNLLSSSVDFYFDVYDSNIPAGSITVGPDIINLAGGSNYRFSSMAGNDTINISSTVSSNFVFAGAGNDTVYANSNNNKVYGEQGNDALKITGALGNNLLSGGEGDDELWLSQTVGTNNLVFGGDGNDKIKISSYAMGTVQSNTELIDGGDGFDSILIEPSGNFDFSVIDMDKIHDIEKVVSITGANTFTLDILDISEHTSADYLFIANAASVTVENANGAEILTLASANVSNPYVSDGLYYDVYTNGNQTLYIEVGTTVTGTGI